jgi:hypothetical protein
MCKDASHQLREMELIMAFMLMINKLIYIGTAPCHLVLKADILILLYKIMKLYLDREIKQMQH